MLSTSSFQVVVSSMSGSGSAKNNIHYFSWKKSDKKKQIDAKALTDTRYHINTENRIRTFYSHRLNTHDEGTPAEVLGIKNKIKFKK